MSNAELLEKINLPKMCAVRQNFSAEHIEDIENAVICALKREGTLDRIHEGMSVAVTGGSRGVSNIAKIIKTICEQVALKGAHPFVVPAMGSHGGATSEGQVRVLESLGITEEYLGFPIKSEIEPVELGVVPNGAIAMFDKNAYEADATIVVNRVKEHPAFINRVESGLCKMIVIGLGKQRGADQAHRTAIQNLGPIIEEIARYTISKSNIVFAVGLIENAFEQTAEIAAVPVEKIMEEEPLLLERSKKLMPKIIPQNFDVLIMDEIGKNICGGGYDTKVVGRIPNPDVKDTASFKRMAILRLTEETHGNGMGISNADVCNSCIVDEMDFEQTYMNSITSLTPFSCKIPMNFRTDKQVIQAAVKMCPDLPNTDDARIVRIHNTKTLGNIWVSENMLDELRDNSDIEIVGEAEELIFNDADNIAGLRTVTK